MAEVLEVKDDIVEGTPENKFISNRRNDALKLVAMITMFIDHLGHMGIVGMIVDKLTAAGTIVLFDWYKLSRTIGRIAFPIFAYQVALGYSKTSNLKKYIQRLFIFAIISEIPYMLFSSDFVIHPLHFNVIFMLLVGVFVIMIYEKVKTLWKESNVLSRLLSIVLVVLMIAIILFPQYAVGTINSNLEPASMEPVFTVGEIDFTVSYDFAFSYGSYGIMMVLFFHIFKGKPLKMILGYVVLSALDVWFTTAGSLFAHGAQWFGKSYTFFGSFLDFEQIEMLIKWNDGYKTLDVFLFQERSLLALPFIILLERFYIKVKLNKFVGYWFYPAHIALIFVIALIMVQVL